MNTKNQTKLPSMVITSAYQSAKERDPSLLACRSVPSRPQTSASTTRKQESNVYTTVQQIGRRGFLQWARFACMAERSEKDPSCKSTKQNFISYCLVHALGS